jgi:hypothetical protein
MPRGMQRSRSPSPSCARRDNGREPARRRGSPSVPTPARHAAAGHRAPAAIPRTPRRILRPLHRRFTHPRRIVAPWPIPGRATAHEAETERWTSSTPPGPRPRSRRCGGASTTGSTARWRPGSARPRPCPGRLLWRNSRRRSDPSPSTRQTTRRSAAPAPIHAPSPPALRHRMVESVRSGRTPEDLARESGPAAQSIRTWLRHAARGRGAPLTGSPRSGSGGETAPSSRTE